MKKKLKHQFIVAILIVSIGIGVTITLLIILVVVRGWLWRGASVRISIRATRCRRHIFLVVVQQWRRFIKLWLGHARLIRVVVQRLFLLCHKINARRACFHAFVGRWRGVQGHRVLFVLHLRVFERRSSPFAGAEGGCRRHISGRSETVRVFRQLHWRGGTLFLVGSCARVRLFLLFGFTALTTKEPVRFSPLHRRQQIVYLANADGTETDLLISWELVDSLDSLDFRCYPCRTFISNGFKESIGR